MLAAFIEKEDPDILLIQEIKAKEEQLDESLTDDTFLRLYHSAEKPAMPAPLFYPPEKQECV